MGTDLKGKELGKGITQRKDGRYQARFTDRFGKRPTVYGKTLKEVKNKLTKETTKDYLKTNINKSITLNELFPLWLEHKKYLIQPITQAEYISVYNRIIRPTFGKLKLTKIDTGMVTDFFNDLFKMGYKRSSLDRYKCIFSNMLEYAISNDYINKNPTKGVKLPVDLTDTRKEKVDALSINDERDFIKMSNASFYSDLFIVALNTGLRVGELAGLTINDIDFENKTINVDKALKYFKDPDSEEFKLTFGPPKTPTSYRVIPMTKECENALHRYLIIRKFLVKRIQNDINEEFKDLLFFTTRGTPLNSSILDDNIFKIIKRINKEREETGAQPLKRFGMHTFRHTFATRCFEAGIDSKVIQTYLGHSSISTTLDTYVDATQNQLNQSIKKLDDMPKFSFVNTEPKYLK